jgi:hypothetical protein
MVLVDSDFRLVKSEHTVNNINSLGGEMTDIEVSESIDSLWDEIKNSELSSSVVGEYEVRCIYVRNYSPNLETMKQVQVWIEQNTAAPFTDVDIGVGTAQMGDIEQTVANEDTLPDNIVWTFARGEENAEFLGDIEAGKGKSIWIRRHAGPTRSGSSYPSDNYILRFKFLRTGALEPGPGPDPTLDPFGIRMIYRTQTQDTVSAPFFMNMNDPYADCRFNTQGDAKATKNGDGSWALGPAPRIRLFTSVSGCARDVIYNATLDTYDHDVWGDRGYMYAPNDWKNVEITGYFKVVTADPANMSERKLYLYSRSLRHNTGIGGGCSGTAYKGVVYGSDQVLKWHKESFHNGAQPCGDRNIETFKTGIPRTDNNQWFGMKVMMWNYPDPEFPQFSDVHLELWTDFDNNNVWTKQGERNDTGGWYPGAPDPNCPGDEYCGGKQDQKITWGGPITEIRWDGAYTNVHFKNLSVREIIPEQAAPIPPPPSPPPGSPPPSPPPPAAGSLDTFGIIMLNETKSGGKTWFSTAWASNGSRLLSANNKDPFDSRFQYENGSPDTTQLEITGTSPGEAKHPNEYNTSCRMRVLDTWLNTEMTIYQFRESADPTTTDMQMRSRSRHETACSFGNYVAKFLDRRGNTLGQPEDTSASIEVEVMHPNYVRGLDQRPFTTGIPKNQWVGFKQITRTITSSGQVKVEGYINYDITKQTVADWVKTSEYTFSGTNVGIPSAWDTEPTITDCAGTGDGTADKVLAGDGNCFRYASTGNMCWVRVNDVQNVRWKFYSVREINPL